MSSQQINYRLALATSVMFPGFHPDDAHLAFSLQRLGIEPVPCIWNDPAVDWPRFDAVLIRATWDYFQKFAEFKDWLDRVTVPLINNAALLRWNCDKGYLPELARHGVEIVPTLVTTAEDLTSTLATLDGREVVVKPTVSGGGWHTIRGVVGEAEFEKAARQLPRELDYLVQPFVPAVVNDGEWSLLFFDGEYSHSILKRAAPGDYRVQGTFGGSTEALEPGGSILAAAHRALTATAELGHGDHAYARVDGVVVDGRFLLMELEMIEPLLFLADRPDAAERFAANLLRRLSGLAASMSP